MRLPAIIILAATALLTLGCASAPPPPVFAPGPAVTEIRDDAPIPMPPEREFHRISYILDVHALRQSRDVFGLIDASPALDVNRYGEVPRSSWWAGVDGRQGADAVAHGPGGDDPGPEAHFPWTVTGLKVGGRNPGFVFRDARGVSYICKFDKEDEPSVSTAAGAVAARLFWALGYHVPDDRVAAFRRHDLRIAPDATVKNSLGEKRPLERRHIDAMLEEVGPPRADGTHRALVSRFLDGVPRGGFALSGTNPHDPNDRIPHQDRRSLRALRVFGAWLNHVDLKEDNTLDVYVGEPGSGHLVHHLVDFDGCLGGYWAARHEPRIGWAYDFDMRTFFGGIVTFGIPVRPWEGVDAPEHPEVGVYTDRPFDPEAWRANYVNDQVLHCRPADAFWAGTVLAGLDDAAVDAAVRLARYDDPAAHDVLSRVLRHRRDAVLDWALAAVSPAVDLAPVPAGDAFGVDARSALADAGRPDTLRWRVEALDAAGDRLGIIAQNATDPAATVPTLLCMDRETVIVRWTALQDGRELPPTDAHYMRTGSGWQLTGILRDGS